MTSIAFRRLKCPPELLGDWSVWLETESGIITGGRSVYRLMDHGLWWPLLDGKRLAIVSGHADKFAARLVDPEFVKATGGRVIDWSVATKISCPDKTVAKQEFWNRLRDELFEAEWDLLLCSAGSLSAVICETARQRGRRAIDVGALDQ